MGYESYMKLAETSFMQFRYTILRSLSSAFSDLTENIDNSLLFFCTYFLCGTSHSQSHFLRYPMLRSLLCCHTSRRDSHMSLKSLIQRFPRKCTIIGGTDTKWRRLRKSQPFCLWYKQLFVWSAKLLANAVFLARQKHSSRGIVKAILFFFSFFFSPDSV